MKYITRVHRTEHHDVEVEAPNRDEAIRLARVKHPGFTTDFVEELDADGESVASHEHIASCECCGKELWMGAPYEMSDEGCYFCETCLSGMAVS